MKNSSALLSLEQSSQVSGGRSKPHSAYIEVINHQFWIGYNYHFG